GVSHPNREGNEHAYPRFHTTMKDSMITMGVTNPHNEFRDMKTEEGEETFVEFNMGPKGGIRGLWFVGMLIIMEEQVKIVVYKLRGGAGAWCQREQDNRRAQGKRRMDN
nr:transposon Ty3-I Gag-Pol polyprotein [Tanacetum cinerariifolium]